MSSNRLNVSFFASTTTTTPQLRVGISFPELCTFLGPPKSYLAKDAAPLYSPAEWLPGHTRGKEGIACIHFGVLDLDHWKPDDIPGLVEDLHRSRTAYYLASTWRNGEIENDLCARLLVPFSRPVLPSEWPRFWPAFNAAVARGRADDMCKDASRSYFFPSFCEGRHVEPFSDTNFLGTPVDVDAILARVGGAAVGNIDVAGVAPSASAAFTRESLKALAQSFIASKREHTKQIGFLLSRVVKGVPYAREPGTFGSLIDDGVVLPEGRNDTTFKMIAKICEHFPHAEPQQIVDQFQPSTSLMGGPDMHEILSMIERQQAGAKQAHAALIHRAIGRFEPYTDAELQMLADKHEVSLSTLRSHWIIQKGKTFYVLRHDGYRRYSDSEIEVAAAVELAPAIRANVDTHKITQHGTRPKTAKELMYDYGTIAKEIIVDLTAQYSYFDEGSKSLVEAPCPVRVQAREHRDVAEWLHVFGGRNYERLCQWLAVLTALKEPCAALYLEGMPGTGKSLLAHGIARIWATKGPTRMAEVMGKWNDPLTKCPLVFADEKSPVDERGRVRTDDLREFIQARNRPLTRRFHDNATIVGCARIILAANNRNLLETTQHLTEADIAAIVERIFYLHANPEAKEYLVDVLSKDPDTAKRWVDGDAIAEHCLFLAETVKVPRTSRFLVAGQSSDLTKSLAVGTGLRASVAEWLVGYLLSPERFSKGPKAGSLGKLVRVDRGRFLVLARALAEAWGEYVHSDHLPPPTMAIAKALAGLTMNEPVTLRVGKKNEKFRQVKLDLLVKWAEDTGFASKEDLDDALVKVENLIPPARSGGENS